MGVAAPAPAALEAAQGQGFVDGAGEEQRVCGHHGRQSQLCTKD